MKNVMIALLVGMFFFSCDDKKNDDKDNDKQRHELRKFNVKAKTSEHSYGRFFLFAGSYSSSKTEKITVRMYFKNCNGEYQFLEAPLEQVKIKIDTVDVPYVTFHNVKNCSNMYFNYERHVVIHCKESEFQPEININDLK